jgi:hypothetical protein
MLAIEDRPMTIAADNSAFLQTRGAVAKILLDNVLHHDGTKPQLAQRDIAAMTGADWYTVHMSLKSIRDSGAIKMERNRIIINQESLRRLAGEAGGALS